MATSMGRLSAPPQPPHKNGKVLRLGDLIGERLDIELNGRVLKAWVVRNQRYPASVAAAIEDARQTYLESRELLTDPDVGLQLVTAARALADASEEETPGTAILQPLLNDLREALKLHDEPRYKIRATEWERYVSATVNALVPGLEDWEVDMMGTEMRYKLLEELGYFRGNDEAGEGQEPPEETPSTGDEPQLGLLTSTT